MLRVATSTPASKSTTGTVLGVGVKLMAAAWLSKYVGYLKMLYRLELRVKYLNQIIIINKNNCYQ